MSLKEDLEKFASKKMLWWPTGDPDDTDIRREAYAEGWNDCKNALALLLGLPMKTTQEVQDETAEALRKLIEDENA